MRAKIVAPPPMILITFAKHCALFTIDGALLGSYGVPLFPQQPPVNLLDVKVKQTYYDSFNQQGSSNSLMGLTLRSFSGTSTGPSVFRPYSDVYDGLIPLIPAQSQPFQVGGKLRERMQQLRKKGGNFGISAQVERQLNMSMQSSQNATMISQTGTPSYNKTSQMLPSTPMQPQTDRNKEDNSTTLQGRQSDKIDLTIQTQNKLRNTENVQSSQTLVSRTPNKMLDSGMQMPSIQMAVPNEGDYIPTGLPATQKGITVQTHLTTPTELLLYRRKQMLGKSSQQSATPPSLLVVD
ncbi:MAG: hypothetical protein EZS28_036844 [Streblomastix strix]|uniref:Uncharacterized protein n=1 Tax=Streblomastix strix TaxID=222440 RepID=A0A5J4UBP9_9EUKA|nr:MAG: hypothetical protein EZS28_036844 [Streblomastix strix]